MAEATRPAPSSVGVVLVHGNGVADPGWINPYVIERLREHLAAAGPHMTLTPDDGSIVRDEVEDLPPDTPGGKQPMFPITERGGTVGPNQRVTFIEMNWSDLSAVGASPAAQFLAGLRLLYEAPNVLCRAALSSQSQSIFHRLLRGLILLATNVVRWVIAGLIGAIVSASLFVGIANGIAEPLADTRIGQWLRLYDGRMLGPTLAWFFVIAHVLIMIGSIRFARNSEREGGGLAEGAYSTAFFSGIFALGLAAFTISGRNSFVVPTEYLTVANVALVVPWILWSMLVILASALILLLALKRTVLRRPPDAPSLARLAGSLGLAAQQGAFLKIAIAVVGLVILKVRYRLDCEPGTINEKFCAPFVHQVLPQDLIRLEGVLTINALIVAGAIGLAALLLAWPALLKRVFGASPRLVNRLRARVILSYSIVVALIVLTLINSYVFYGGIAIEWYNEVVAIGRQMGLSSMTELKPPRLPLPALLGWANYEQIARNSVLHLVLIVGLIAIGTLMIEGRAQAFFSGLVHFARDVVDHHYRAITKVPRLVATVEDKLPTMIAGRGLEYPRSEQDKFPRRERVKRRLDQVMETLLNGRKFDRLVFIAHSQGTVIVHDYLQTFEHHGRMASAAEVHVLTLASPITHLYQHYFEDYRTAGIAPSWLPPNLVSWTNMWRVDDPIAGPVRLVGPPAIADGLLGLGGHSDYWKEKPVMDVVARLITAPLGTSAFLPADIAVAKPVPTANAPAPGPAPAPAADVPSVFPPALPDAGRSA